MLVIGFTNESFTVTEGVDVQNITVGLISGQLERNVTVVLTLQSDSAIGKCKCEHHIIISYLLSIQLEMISTLIDLPLTVIIIDLLSVHKITICHKTFLFT